MAHAAATDPCILRSQTVERLGGRKRRRPLPIRPNLACCETLSASAGLQLREKWEAPLVDFAKRIWGAIGVPSSKGARRECV